MEKLHRMVLTIKLVINGKGNIGYLIKWSQKPNSSNINLLQQCSSENSMIIAWFVNSILPVIGRCIKNVWIKNKIVADEIRRDEGYQLLHGNDLFGGRVGFML